MNTLKTTLISIMLLVFTSGCINVNQSFKETRNKVFSFLGKATDKEIEFGLGSAGLTFLGSMVRFSEQDKLPADLMAHLSGIQVGVYNYNDVEKTNLTDIRSFSHDMFDEGWECIVRASDEKNTSFVFIKKNISAGIKELLVVSREDEKLVIAELKGDLESAVITLIRNKRFNFEMADKENF